VITNQVGLVALLALANGAGQEGAVSAWSYAYLFFQLPYGLFAVAIMTTFLPELSSAFGRSDLAAYRDRFVLGLRLILLVVLPSAVLLGLLATPTVTVLFERGAFDGASTELTAGALAAFAAGLPGFSAYLYAMRGFYARQDTRTPFLVNVGQTVLTVALAVPLAAAFDLVGVVAAFSIAYSVGAVVALAVLRQRVGGLASGSALGALVRLVGATVVMAGVVALVAGVRDVEGPGASLVELVVAGTVGTIAFLGVLAATRSDDLVMVRQRLRPGR
jgi:putative peptidoglycan lipid II flippase